MRYMSYNTKQELKRHKEEKIWLQQPLSCNITSNSDYNNYDIILGYPNQKDKVRLFIKEKRKTKLEKFNLSSRRQSYHSSPSYDNAKPQDITIYKT